MNMHYPQAPWNLYGNALQSFHLIDLDKAKALVPKDLEVIAVLPGKTLGGLYFSIYEANSTLCYHELIVTAALVRYQGIIGAWISHIYVDHPESVAGGRNIWGLPKEMADFTWGEGDVRVAQGNTALCQVQYGQVGLPLSFGGKTKLSGTILSGLEKDILSFQGHFEARLRWVSCHLTIPPESPFAMLNLGHPWFTLQFLNLHLTANAPAVAGQWTSLERYSARSTHETQASD
jgi:acetoacetate decarboxylase